MFSSFLRRRKEPIRDLAVSVLPPEVPAGRRVYAVGDVHGRSDLLRAMIQMIEADLEQSPCRDVVSVFSGDYVDRGPHSKDVIEILASGSAPGDVIALKGNHEELMLNFLSEPGKVADLWLRLGGLETLFSYGVDIREVRRGRGVQEASRSFFQKLPKQHLDFLESMPLSTCVGDYFFCHAGVRPGVPLEMQKEEDLLWIRGEFLSTGHRFGKVIVHGHTPVRRPEIRSNRINVDTGAYITNRLTCVVLEGAAQRFLCT